MSTGFSQELLMTFIRRVSVKLWVDKTRLQQVEEHVKGEEEETMNINDLLMKSDCEGKETLARNKCKIG